MLNSFDEMGWNSHTSYAILEIDATRLRCCVGVALVYPIVKHNRIKPKLKMIRRILGGDGARR